MIGCGPSVDDEDLPEEMQPAESAMVGQAGFQNDPVILTPEHLSNGFILDTKMNFVKLSVDFGEISSEELFASLGDNLFYIYNLDTGTLVIPKTATTRYNSYCLDGTLCDYYKSKEKWMKTVDLDNRLRIWMDKYPTTWTYSGGAPPSDDGASGTFDNYNCPVLSMGKTGTPTYYGGLWVNGSNAVPGCKIEGNKWTGQCVSEETGEVGGPATGCADFTEFPSMSQIAKKVRVAACVSPCEFTYGGLAGDTCELPEGVTVAAASPIKVEDVQYDGEGEVEIVVENEVVSVNAGEITVSFGSDEKVTGVQIQGNKVLVTEETPGAGSVIKDVYLDITNNNAGAYLCPYAKTIEEVMPDCDSIITEYDIVDGKYHLHGAGGGAGEEENFCYYLDENGEQMPAGTQFAYSHSGVVTEEGTFENNCDGTEITRERCGEDLAAWQNDWKSGENVEKGEPKIQGCATVGCDPDLPSNALSCCLHSIVESGEYAPACDGNTAVSYTQNSCDGDDVVKNSSVCSDWSSESNIYTCYSDPEHEYSYWNVPGCQVCGKKICVNSEGSRYLSNKCTGGWVDTGEVVTGPGCE